MFFQDSGEKNPNEFHCRRISLVDLNNYVNDLQYVV